MEMASRGELISQPDFKYDYDKHVKLNLELGSLKSIKNSRAICSDDSSGNTLYTKDIRLVLEDIPQKINLLGMDACLMGMAEVAYEVKDEANVFVASEETEPGFGWPYHLILKPLTANPSMDEEKLGKIIVNAYGQYCDKLGSSLNPPPPTQSAIRLSEMSNLADKINTFVRSVSKKTQTREETNFLSIRNNSPAFTRRSYIDYKGFLSKIPDSINININPVQQAISKAVIANYSHKSGKATGLSVFFPKSSSGEYSDYKANNIKFAKDTLWDEFLAYVIEGHELTTQEPADNLTESDSNKVNLGFSKLIAVRNKKSNKPSSNIKPGETIYLKAFYDTQNVPAKHGEVIMWGVFDTKGNYLKNFERLQLESAKNGKWILYNKLKIPKNFVKGKYYAFCDISIYSLLLKEKASAKKIGSLPVGVDKNLKSVVPKIDRKTYDYKKNSMLNKAKLLIVDAPQSRLNLRLAVNKSGQIPEYQVGENFKLGIKSSKTAYFAMLAKQTDGSTQVIYPNIKNPMPKVQADVITYFPAKGKASLKIGPPAGIEQIKVIASINPITLESLNQYFITGQLPFAGDWNEASISIKIKSNSDPVLGKVNQLKNLNLTYNQDINNADNNTENYMEKVYQLPSMYPFSLKMAFNVQGSQPVFYIGQKGLKIGVKPEVSVYLTLLHRDSNGKLSILMPQAKAMMNQIFYFPAANQGTLRVAPPYGVNQVTAIASLDSLNWNNPESVYNYLTLNSNRWTSAFNKYEVR